MKADKVNKLQLLGTIQNADESGIIVYADQVYDKTGEKSVEERITEVANSASGGNTAATKAQETADAAKTAAATAQSTADSALSKANSNASEISALKTSVGNINQFEYEAVSYLPTASADTMYKIYLVPTGVTTEKNTVEPTIEPGKANNVRDEYITLKNGSTYYWEKLGTTDVDLSGYAKTSAIPTNNNQLANGAGYQTADEVKAIKVNSATSADSANTANSATAASEDSNGNVISETYLTSDVRNTVAYSNVLSSLGLG